MIYALIKTKNLKTAWAKAHPTCCYILRTKIFDLSTSFVAREA